MNEEIEVLRIVSERLTHAQIPHMLTGSFAMAAYVTPRMTRDIDIVIDAEVDDAQKLYELFAQDFYVDKITAEDEIRRRGMFNIIHLESLVKVDLIVSKDNPYGAVKFDRRRLGVAHGVTVPVVSIEDLIISKLEWAKESKSELQLRDIRALLSEGSVDTSYVMRWVEELNLQAIYAQANR